MSCPRENAMKKTAKESCVKKEFVAKLCCTALKAGRYISVESGAKADINARVKIR